jgi:Flp pilus assembly protein CpaB
MINDPFHPEEAIAREKESTRRKLLGVVCAVAVTAVLLVGYAVMRRFHAQQVQANQVVPAPPDSGPKGPPVAHILVDQPSLEKGMTTIGGVVKNTSQADLNGLTIALELHRRKDGKSEHKLVPVEPTTLEPQQEGSYALKVSASDYGSITLVGLRADPDSKLIAFTTSPGKQRTPERLEPRTVIVKKPGRPGEFLNTPDNPTRVP